jgi:acetyl-CoA carboxylase biotin carboxyl carrier protein
VSAPAEAELELLLEQREESQLLLAPAVGLFTGALPRGRVLLPGERAGVLLVLGRAHALIVPAGAAGSVLGVAPARVRHPVGFRDALYELGALAGLAAGAAQSSGHSSATASGGLALRATTSGRFWHRPSPGEQPFVRAGDELREGQAVGMIEVMKTFTEVRYRAADGLPPRARVLRIAAAEGAEIAERDVLLELEAV